MPTAQVQFLIRELRSQKPCRTAKEEKNLGNTLGFPKIYPKTKLVIVQSLSHVWLFATLWTAACWLPLSSTISGVCSNLCPWSQRFYLTISSFAAPFFCFRSYPASRSFPMSWLFTSGGQSIGASASASVLLMNIQGWYPLGLTGLISLQSKGLSRVFSSTMIKKHKFFGTQPSLWSNSHIRTWLLENS